MGIYRPQSGLTRFRVTGELPQEDLRDWVGEHLQGNAFRPIDNTLEQESFGWVTIDDNDDADFATPDTYVRDRVLAFTLRRDQRRVPSVLKKREVAQLSTQFLAENPGYQKVPKRVREEFTDHALSRLLGRTLPVPSFSDAVWDIDEGLVTLFSTSKGTIDLFETLFARTFPGLRLVTIIPAAWMETIAPVEILQNLTRELADAPQQLSSRIDATRWIGTDFFLWLIGCELDGPGSFTVCRPGLLHEGGPFAAGFHQRLVLKHGEDGQKISITGTPGDFAEAKTALTGGKEILEAGIQLMSGEDEWRLTLKGDLFQLAGFRTPPAAPKEHDAVDARSEQVALFYEKLALLQKGFQLLESLFIHFLRARCGGEWGARRTAIERLLAG